MSFAKTNNNILSIRRIAAPNIKY